jgi:hypothetical protein
MGMENNIKSSTQISRVKWSHPKDFPLQSKCPRNVIAQQTSENGIYSPLA